MRADDDGASHSGESNAFDVRSIGQLAVNVPVSAAEGGVPVTGTVSVSPAPGVNLMVSLSSGDTTEATVPATTTILAGQTSATFTITIIDDGVLDGSQAVAITADAYWLRQQLRQHFD